MNMGHEKPRIVVAHLVISLNVGGLEMVVLDLVRASNRARFAPRVICLEGPGLLAPRFEAIGIPVETIGLARGGMLGSICRLARRLRATGTHVVHTHNMAPHFQGALAARAAGVPVLVHTKHGRNYPDHRRSVLANRFASSLSDCVVPVSEDAAVIAVGTESVPASKVRVIHNGIDLARFPEQPPPSMRPIRRAITVARLHPIKDQATMLKATRLVVDSEPGFSLDLVGDGPALEGLEALRDSLGLRDNVRFLGYRSDVREPLAEADIFVLSSLSEGISLTLLEAMAAHLPAVATDVGGNREVVVDGETGLLVPSASPKDLARAMLRLVSNPEEARRMGRAGRHRVESEFDLRRVVATYENLYLSLLRTKQAWRTVFSEIADRETPRLIAEPELESRVRST